MNRHPGSPQTLEATHRSYRNDIDGLRALAVLPVVAFHAGFGSISGGFVGVDIFFVISGYLITGILFEEIASDQFSILRFYERRIRRIFPAMFAVLAVSLFLGYFLLLPSELVDLSKSTAAGALSVANFYFYSTTDYFSSDAEAKPLLHLWSLAVEEQFYVIFPVILLLLHRYIPRALRAALIILAVISLVAASICVFEDASQAFYQPQFRAWELLAGGILAVFQTTAPRQAWLRNLLSTVGFGMILASLRLLGPQIPFPGLSALPACLGAVLIIFSASADRGNLVSWGLSLSPIRFIGKVSYSLYLWHWPIIIFLKQGAAFSSFPMPAGTYGKLLVLLLSFIGAVISYYVIERPFRHSSPRVTHRQVILAGCGAIAVMIAVASIIVAQEGYPRRFSEKIQRLGSYMPYAGASAVRPGVCFLGLSNDFGDFDVRECLTHKRGVKNYLLIGDSHAAQYWSALSTALAHGHVGQITAAGCRATIEQDFKSPPRCTQTLGYGFGKGLDDFQPDVVYVAGRWQADDIPALGRTLDTLKRRVPKVVLIGPGVEYDAPLPRLLIVGAMRGDPGWADKHEVATRGDIDVALSHLARSKGVTYLSPFAVVCPGRACQATLKDGAPVVFDYGHLTQQGAAMIVESWRKSDPKAF